MASSQKVILITGASNGIGYDTSYTLAAASASNHIIMACRSMEKGEKALAEIRARKPVGTLSLIQLDVTSDSSIEAAAKKLLSDFDRIDILINNAGIAADDPPSTREILRSTFETNVFGPTLVTQALEPLLQKSKDPKIVNVTSGLGSLAWRVDPTNAFYHVPFVTYRMSKAALNMMSVCQTYHYQGWEHPAKVFAYCPGYVITDLGGGGEANRQARRDTGAESSEVSAKGILEIVEGRRDHEANHYVNHKGGQYPW